MLATSSGACQPSRCGARLSWIAPRSVERESTARELLNMQPDRNNPTTGAGTFGLSTLMLAVALFAVWFAVLRASLPVGVALTPAFPALIALGVVVQRWRKRGVRMQPRQVVGTLGWLVFSSYIWTFLGAALTWGFLGFLGVSLPVLLEARGVQVSSFVVSGNLLRLLLGLVYFTVMIGPLCAGLRREIKEESPPIEW